MSILRVNEVQNISGQEIFDGSTGTMILPAGNSLQAPLRMQAGTTLTNPISGSIEYNGNSFVVTSDATSGKAFLDDSLMYTIPADRTIVTTVVASTFYSIFGVGLNVSAGSAYLFDIMFGLRTGITSHTVSFNFGGTATYSSMQYRTEFTNVAISTGIAAPAAATSSVTSMFTANPTTAANGVISPASVTTSKFARIHGMVIVNTAGTVVPQIGFSANPTGTNQITSRSYARFNSLGTFSGEPTIGNWSAVL